MVNRNIVQVMVMAMMGDGDCEDDQPPIECYPWFINPLPVVQPRERALRDLEKVRRALAAHWSCFHGGPSVPRPILARELFRGNALKRRLRSRWWLRYL